MSVQSILILREMANKKPGVSGFSRSQIEAIQAAVDLMEAINRGGYYVSRCVFCKEPTVCTPVLNDFVRCKDCAKKAGGVI